MDALRYFLEYLSRHSVAKQRRLILAARHWLLRHGEAPCRFDAVLIDGDRLEWLRAAFAAD